MESLSFYRIAVFGGKSQECSETRCFI
jgi:hypothetical protein